MLVVFLMLMCIGFASAYKCVLACHLGVFYSIVFLSRGEEVTKSMVISQLIYQSLVGVNDR